jgi:hypothetical protein
MKASWIKWMKSSQTKVGYSREPKKKLGCYKYFMDSSKTKFQILVSIPTWNFRYFGKGKESGIQQIKKGKKEKKRRRAKVDKLKGEEQKTCAWKMIYMDENHVSTIHNWIFF